jgi:drug/metabolite transporter (DMT)-like permease
MRWRSCSALPCCGRRRASATPSPLLVSIALSAGWCNIGFTLAVIYGDVMRVVLLFYLAPVWTVLFARVLLGERLTAAGYGLMLLAMSGAMIMLWDPRMGLPLPRSLAEWGALSAGAMFALSNVLVRRSTGYPIETKTLAVLAGCTAIGALAMLFDPPRAATGAHVLEQALLLFLLAVVLLSVNVAVQYGLTRIAANRAIVIYLFELVVAAVSTWLLVGETLALNEWCGGALIIMAGVLSERIGGTTPPSPDAAAAQCGNSVEAARAR